MRSSISALPSTVEAVSETVIPPPVRNCFSTASV